MELKDSNDLFGLILKLKNQNNICQITKIMKETETDSITLQKWINELQSKKYIKQISMDDIFVDKQYEKKYLSPLKKFFNRIVSFIKIIFRIKEQLE